MSLKRNVGMIAAGVMGLAIGVAALRRIGRIHFRGRTAVITGGSRGLGLVIARQLAREGARLALLARDEEELRAAADQIHELGADGFTIVCDVTKQEDVDRAITQVVRRFGGVDLLINNAGVIQVGPLEHMTVDDFRTSIDVHIMGPLYTMLAVVPHMRKSGGGRIVNIASIGGKIGTPHLVPYSTGKFGLVGLSDGARAELRRDRIYVTTVIPGLMRTGSPYHAKFKGPHRAEFAWFIAGDSMPLVSINAERAAAKVIEAAREGRASLYITPQARLVAILNELMPGVTASLAGLANRLMPRPTPDRNTADHTGFQSRSDKTPAIVTALTDRAAKKNNELKGNA